MIAEARDGFQGGGNAAQLDVLLGVAASPQPVDMWLVKDGKCRRWAVRMMAVNAVIFAVSAAIVAILGHRKSLPMAVIAALVAAFTLLGILYLCLDLTLGRLIPRLRRHTGHILLILACFPWLLGLMVVYIMNTGPNR